MFDDNGFNFKKYDFSKESAIKDKLFAEMMLEYKKSRGKAIRLSDDDLDLVSAAAGSPDIMSCPFAGNKCCDCEHYNAIEDHCRFGCKK